MKEALYMNDSYLKEFEAEVVSVKDDKYVVLDKTAFYPNGGGQPADTGTLICNNEEYPIVFAGKFEGKISHEVSKPGLKIGDKVLGKINWDRRYKLMRMHTAAHIIDAVFYLKEKALCTGNQIGEEKTRIDFSSETLTREKMQEYISLSNEIIRKEIGVKIYTMKREEALKIDGMVKLAGVMPPNIHELRIVEIPGVDIQADGGTQVNNTSEIGEIEFLQFENRGKSNKRLYYKLK